jgi:hypothetical protein
MKYVVRLTALAIAVGIIYYLQSNIEPTIESEMFCAYNRVFVKFKEGSHVWGTMLLDDSGSPVHCDFEKTVEKIKRIENII